MKNGITALKITFDFGCGPDCIYPAALCSDEDVYLVDCGYAGFLPLIEDAMRGAGLEPGALAGVIITHHDHDHMGSLAALRAKYPRVKVYASAVEAEYISGRRKALRLEQAEALQPALPEDARAGGEAFMGTVTASGIPEAIAAAILVTALGKALLSFFQKQLISGR